MMGAPMNLLTFGEAPGTPAPVSTQTVLVRIESRREFRRSGALRVQPRRVFLWSGASGAAKPAVFREGPRSFNRRSPATRLKADGRVHKGTLTMSDKASGDATPRATFDPSTKIGYYLSQDSHLDLQQLVSAIYAAGVMATTPTGEVGADIELHQLAPLFFTLARAGERIIEDLVDSFPAPRRAPAAPTNDRRAA